MWVSSDISRLVLGYLVDIGCYKTYETFLQECSHFKRFEEDFPKKPRSDSGWKFLVGGRNLRSVLKKFDELDKFNLQFASTGDHNIPHKYAQHSWLAMEKANRVIKSCQDSLLKGGLVEDVCAATIPKKVRRSLYPTSGSSVSPNFIQDANLLKQQIDAENRCLSKYVESTNHETTNQQTPDEKSSDEVANEFSSPLSRRRPRKTPKKLGDFERENISQDVLKRQYIDHRAISVCGAAVISGIKKLSQIEGNSTCGKPTNCCMKSALEKQNVIMEHALDIISEPANRTVEDCAIAKEIESVLDLDNYSTDSSVFYQFFPGTSNLTKRSKQKNLLPPNLVLTETETAVRNLQKSSNQFAGCSSNNSLNFADFSTNVMPTTTPQTVMTSSEAPQKAMTSSEAPQTVMTSSEAPQTVMTSSEAPQKAMTSLEAPQTVMTSSEAPQKAMTSSEAPQTAMTSSETPQKAMTSSEAPQTAVMSLALPQNNMTSSETAVTSSEAPQTTVTSLAPLKESMTSLEASKSTSLEEEEKSAVALATRRSTRKMKRTNDVINNDYETDAKPKRSKRVVTSQKVKKAQLPSRGSKKSSTTSRAKKTTTVTSQKKNTSSAESNPVAKKSDVIISDVVKSCVMTVAEGQEPDLNDVISTFTEQLRANNVTVTSQPPPITTNLTTISPEGVFMTSLATGFHGNDDSNLNAWLNSSQNVNKEAPVSGTSGYIVTSPSRSMMSSTSRDSLPFDCRNDNDDDSSATPKRRSLRSTLMTSQHQRRVNLISVPISPSKLGGTPLRTSMRTPSPTADVIKRDATTKRKNEKQLELSDDVITSNTNDVIKRNTTKKRKDKKQLEEYLRQIDYKEFVTKLHEKKM